MKEPQDRQKALLKYMSENIGISMSQAMKDLGYSESYSNSPDKVKKTKGWRRLMRTYLPNRLLLKVTKEGLEATKPIGALVLISNDEQGKPKQTLKDNEGMIEVADYAVRQKYLETALKMRGKLVDKTDITTKGQKIESNQITFANFKK